MKESINAFTWETLNKFSSKEADRIHGPNNAQSTLRLFGHREEDVKVTLYRDHHAW